MLTYADVWWVIAADMRWLDLHQACKLCGRMLTYADVC
jgi:hypothetical protein